MENSKILIHIGYPKTASTWLQQVIFSDKNSGLFTPWGVKAEHLIRQYLNPNNFDIAAESARQVLEPDLLDAARQNLIPVLSHENLTVTPTIGKGWKKEVANRIHEIFPEARILIIIREQKSMLLSSYRQHVGMGKTSTIQDYIGTSNNESMLTPVCPLDFFKYDELIEYYQNVFGKDNVLVLPFELLKKSQQIFCQKIFDFVGVNGQINDSQIQNKKNVGIKRGKLTVLRQLNFLFPPYHEPTLRLRYKLAAGVALLIPEAIHEGIENRLRQFIAQRVGDYYRLSNQKTSQLIGMNLADFGYDC